MRLPLLSARKKRIVASVIVVLSAMFSLAFSNVAYAQEQDAKTAICLGAGGTLDDKGQCTIKTGGRTVTGTIQKVVNLLIFLVGAISVIMIIIGGLRYALSGGDQSGINSAKNTILYAIIGLVVSFSAYGIVNFVLVQFKII